MDGQELLDWMFEQTVETPEGCWEWSLSRNPAGYGQTRYRGKQINTHRLVLHLQGRLPKGMCIRHRCDNPPCINPDHLWAGTNSGNVRDRVVKGRGGASRGVAHYTAKLSEGDVREIRRLCDIGVLQRKIADQFAIDQSHVSDIKRRKKWAHVL